MWCNISFNGKTSFDDVTDLRASDFTDASTRSNTFFIEDATQNLVQNIKQETKKAFQETIENSQEVDYWRSNTQDGSRSIPFQTGDAMYVFYKIRLNVTSGNIQSSQTRAYKIYI